MHELDLRARQSQPAGFLSDRGAGTQGRYRQDRPDGRGGLGVRGGTRRRGTGDRCRPRVGEPRRSGGSHSGATIADLLGAELSHYSDIHPHTSVNAVNLEVLAAEDYTSARRALSGKGWLAAVDGASGTTISCRPTVAAAFSTQLRGPFCPMFRIVIVAGASVDGSGRPGRHGVVASQRVSGSARPRLCGDHSSGGARHRGRGGS